MKIQQCRRLAMNVAVVGLLSASLAQASFQHRINLRHFDSICIIVRTSLDDEIQSDLRDELQAAFREKADLLRILADDCGDVPLEVSNTQLLPVMVTFKGFSVDSQLIYTYSLEGTKNLIYRSRDDNYDFVDRMVDDVIVYKRGIFGIGPLNSWKEDVRESLEDMFDEFLFEFKRQSERPPKFF